MGIRFKCHHCQAPLNIKGDLAKKRGVCPHCHGKFRVPNKSQEYSLSVDDTAWNSSTLRDVPASSAELNSESKFFAVSEATTSIASSETQRNEPSTIEQLYFVRPPSGGEYGPAAKETIELWIAQRRVTAETLICLIGTSQWKKAREIFSGHFVFD